MTKTSKTTTAAQIDWVGPAPRPRGRPKMYDTKQEQQAAAARAYRARKKVAKAATRDPGERLHSDIVALDHLPAWRRK